MKKIKICGLKRECDIDYVNEALPDYAGFVFAESRRQVSPVQAKELIRRLHGVIVPVGVFLDEEPARVCTIQKNSGIRIIQLHGKEPPDYVRRVKEQTGCQIIKVLGTGEAAEHEVLQYEAAGVDFFLFDYPIPGSGRSFEWSGIPKTKRPFFLAGGIGMHNVEEALAQTCCDGVDLSSAVETDGVKDREKLLEIVRKVHGSGQSGKDM